MKYKLSTLFCFLVIAALAANGYRQHLQLVGLQERNAELQVERDQLDKDRKWLAHFYAAHQTKLLQLTDQHDSQRRLIQSRSMLLGELTDR
ncbi:MAG: hypothetical protein IT422_09685 [Pirellulaceae bacterium]|jgi:uncharacterized protein YlxW (UPF0749 family)|nr:hypothetical protein [Pirellulaceae bacterium]